jgi:ActR/RegA family two-component response regulator
MMTAVPIRLLLVDNDSSYTATIREFVLDWGWSVDVVSTPEEAISKADSRLYDLCIVGERLTDKGDFGDQSGIELVNTLAQQDRQLRFIVITDFPTWEKARDLLSYEFSELHVLDYIATREGVEALVQRITKLSASISTAVRELYSDQEPPQILVDVLRSINVELIQYLKKHPADLYLIQPYVFEELVAELLASYGWKVDLTKQTRDGGYDIFAIRKDISGVESSWLIECKRYRSERKVGVDVARALYGVKTDLRVGMSMLATTSFFSRDVYDYKSSRYDLVLRDFEGIVEWINEYRPHPAGQLYVKENRLVVPGDPEWKNRRPTIDT